MNLRYLKNNLDQLRGARPDSRPKEARRPIKPSPGNLEPREPTTIEIPRVNILLKEQEPDAKLLASDFTQSKPEEPSSQNPHNQRTPSQAVSQRKSIEKWVDPDPETLGKQKIDLARAIIKDNLGHTGPKKQTSQDFRVRSLNDSKSVRSERSIDDNDHFPPSHRLYQVHSDRQNTRDLLADPKRQSAARPSDHDQVLLENQAEETEKTDRPPEPKPADSQASAPTLANVSPADPPAPKPKPPLELQTDPVLTRADFERSPIPSPLNAPDPKRDPGLLQSLAQSDEPKEAFLESAEALDQQDRHYGNQLTLSLQSKLDYSSPDLHITIDNRDIKTLDDLIDPCILPNFDKEPRTTNVPDKSSLVEVKRTDRESKADQISSEILAGLFDELLMDGFVLRTLFKLQADVPRGIKTNINCVKNYLSSLTDYIVSKLG